MERQTAHAPQPAPQPKEPVAPRPPHPLARMQQALGNQAVGRLIQAKLNINQSGDQYEQEADRVADTVMRMPAPQSDGHRLAITPLTAHQAQRKYAECQEEEEGALQRKESVNAPGTPATAPPIVDRALSSPGRPLDAATRAFFEPRFGSDFSEVHVHDNAMAAESARSINASAYTHGHNIIFGAGQYVPGTTAGQWLLAHELTHVVQQMDSDVTPAIQRNDGTQEDLTDRVEGKTQPEQAEAFIDSYRPDGSLDTKALGKGLRQLVVDSEAEIGFVLSVFDALASEDRDDVAYYFMVRDEDNEAEEDPELEQLAASEDGRRLLTRLQAEMTGGAQWPSETVQIIRINRILADATLPHDLPSLSSAFTEPPTQPSTSEPAAPPYPGDYNSGDFVTDDGDALWQPLQKAWEWAEKSPEYSAGLINWILTSKIPLLKQDTKLGIGGHGLPTAVDGVDVSLTGLLELLNDSARGPRLSHDDLTNPFLFAAEFVQEVDESIPFTRQEKFVELEGVDPLVAVYVRQFPSEERPARLDLQMKMRLALALAERTFPEALRDVTLAAIKDPMFITSVIGLIAIYFILWLIPEPTSKVLASLLTAYLLTMFVWNDIFLFATEWAAFMNVCISTTSEAELRSAGNRITAKAATVTFDVLSMIILYGMGKAGGTALNALKAHAEELQLMSRFKSSLGGRIVGGMMTGLVEAVPVTGNTGGIGPNGPFIEPPGITAPGPFEPPRPPSPQKITPAASEVAPATPASATPATTSAPVAEIPATAETVSSARPAVGPAAAPEFAPPSQPGRMEPVTTGPEGFVEQAPPAFEVVRRRGSRQLGETSATGTPEASRPAIPEAPLLSASEDIEDVWSEETSTAPETEQREFEAQADDVRDQAHPRISESTTGPERKQAAAAAAQRRSGREQTADAESGSEAPEGVWEGSLFDDPYAVPAVPEIYSRPSGWRTGMREEVWEAAKGLDGEVRDPLTGEVMKFDEPWHMGHKPGFEFWKLVVSAMERGISREQFLEEYYNSDHLRPELPESNISHAGELEDDDYLGE